MFSIHYYHIKAGTVASFQTLRQTYHKIPKISPGACFSKALFEGLIFGGAYIQRVLCMEGNMHFKINWANL